MKDSIQSFSDFLVHGGIFFLILGVCLTVFLADLRERK